MFVVDHSKPDLDQCNAKNYCPDHEMKKMKSGHEKIQTKKKNIAMFPKETIASAPHKVKMMIER